MQGVLARAGDHPFGKACALLLGFLVVGSVTGSVLALYGDGRACWPQAMYYTVYAECETEIFQQAWTLGVSLPIMMLQGLVSLLIDVTSGRGFSPGLVDIFTLMVTPPIVFFGFAAWHRWAPPVAWLLLLALIGEIVYLRTLVPI